MSSIFIKITPDVMRKILDIQQFQDKLQTGLFRFWKVEIDEILRESLILMSEKMKEEIKERK